MKDCTIGDEYTRKDMLECGCGRCLKTVEQFENLFVALEVAGLDKELKTVLGQAEGKEAD